MPQARPLISREALRQTYLSTVVIVNDPTEGPLSAPAAVDRYGPLWVVSAANPLGRVLPPAEHQQRHEELVSAVESAGLAWVEALGRSTDGTWQERSLALVACGRRRALKLGRQFSQNAVFHLLAGELRVEGCTSRWTRTRPHGAWTTPRYSDSTLVEVLEDELGLGIPRPFWRFRQPGWRIDGSSELPCDTCTAHLLVASALLTSKAGQLYEAKAVICTRCQRVRLPSHLPTPLREGIYLWSDWQLARADAATSPTGLRRTYVIRLEDAGARRLPSDRPWLYVGETGIEIEDRYRQHLHGEKASPIVRKYGAGLAWELMGDLPVHQSVAESKTYEAYLARRLELLGYGVKGGH